MHRTATRMSRLYGSSKGKMDFRMGSERRIMTAGDLAVIPGGVEHEGSYPEDTEVVDIFAPPREDFLKGGTPA